VFTKPADLTEDALAAALKDRWRFTASSLEYQAVGFGSHHWLAANAEGVRLFATVDDLKAKLRTADDTTDAAFGRLGRAFATAFSLGTDAGLAFVIAPIPGAGGQVLARLADRYSLVIHPYIAGTQVGSYGEFVTGSDRNAVLDLLGQLHSAHAAHAVEPLTDDFVVPQMDALGSMLSESCRTWDGGPYAKRAHDLLRAHAADLEVLITAYGELARRVAARQDRLVITHGEPHAANVMRSASGLVLVDWDTVLLAPPERDLWYLADHDESILDVYASTSGVEIDREALSLYRLWWDLAEISGYLSLFRGPHGETADTEESWQELKHYLRPADRWPALLQPR
jgi:thiamine kinase-like enzyme